MTISKKKKKKQRTMKTKRERLFHAEPSPTMEKLKFPKSC